MKEIHFQFKAKGKEGKKEGDRLAWKNRNLKRRLTAQQ